MLPEQTLPAKQVKGGRSTPWLDKARSLQQHIRQHHFNLVIGLECEFYFLDTLTDAECEKLVADYNQTAELPIVKEDGARQFECHTSSSNQVYEVIRQYERLRETLHTLAGGQVTFTAMPHSDQPRSGMHVHIHAEDANGKRLFYKHDSKMSDALYHCLAGLMANLEEASALLCAHPNAPRQDHVASTVSWGSNNRSTAIRLPESEPDKKRIEYRIATSDTPIEPLLAMILASILDGLERHPELPPAIYGNASDAQYELQKLPQNKAEAEAVLARKFRLRQLLV